MTATAAAPPRRKRTAMEVVRELRQPKVAVMLALGFASGLPFLLSQNTLGYWLRDEGTSLKIIGFASWAGLAYVLKPLWSPVVDRVDVPLLGRLGRRRGWMLLAQIVVAAALIAMAVVGVKTGLTTIVAFAVVVAFASATQDIVIDAWRIEAADGPDELGLLSAAANIGYRVAIIVADAAIIAGAQHFGWPASYVAMAVLMGIGVAASLFAFEPARADAVMQTKAPLWTPRGFLDAVVGPFVEFFATHKGLGLLMLVAIAAYRLPDFLMGPMYNPFYHDLGFSKDAVAAVRFPTGLFGAFVGTAASGVFAVRFGLFRTLITGSILQGLGTASFALLTVSHDLTLFTGVMALDQFAQSFAGVALIAYMSSLTGLGYTATQYALLSSTYAFLGKFLKGFSGQVVDGLSHTQGLMGAYATAWIGTGLTAIPPILLMLLLAHRTRRTSTTTT
ncbi:MAG TPA: MFS transporter [Phenylobacterium sp.]|jgi:PAT family beta-lactamase induction signal transducer AmpG|uniref:AmpG family muropeptide MFS transporter n=1 Tax=Phenylobacterium sp. TaxID=1871053 RepID=UPI002D457B9D|nr:MFS transporter [Phenylobacterium sp.]HZZ69644.1 MFS transporter [Phenylobacterium sp.]